MAKKVWVLRLEDGTYTVELKYHLRGGKRGIFVDGMLIESFTKSSDTGFHQFSVSGHPCVLRKKLEHELYVNGKPVPDQDALFERAVDRDAFINSALYGMFGRFIGNLEQHKAKNKETQRRPSGGRATPLFGEAPDVGKLKAEGDVKGLIKALGYKNDRHVCQAAAEALGQIGGAQAINPLIATLEDGAYHVRKVAATALEKIGWQPDRSEGGAAYWVAKTQWDRCVEIGAPAVGPLIAALNDEDYQVRLGAAESLGQIGDERAMEPLVAALRDEDYRVRNAAATALEKIDWQPDRSEAGAAYWVAKTQWDRCVDIGARAVEPLAAALNKDEDYHVRLRAAESLRQIGNARAVEPLVAALGDEDYHIRYAAAAALRQISDARAVEPLIAAINDEDYHVRYAASKALGQIGDARAVEPLAAAFKDKEDGVREAAAKALGQIGGAQAINPLIAALNDGDYHVRYAATAALEKLGAPAVEPLIAALNDEDYHVRVRAAESLRQIGDARAVEPLVAALNDEDYHIRYAAAEALGQIGDARAVEPLAAAINDGDYHMRLRAAESLEKLGARAVEPVIAALQQGSDEMREAAAKALEKLGVPRRDVDGLIKLLRKSRDPEKGKAAARRLWFIAIYGLLLRKYHDTRRVEEALTTALPDPHDSVPRQAEEAPEQIDSGGEEPKWGF